MERDSDLNAIVFHRSQGGSIIHLESPCFFHRYSLLIRKVNKQFSRVKRAGGGALKQNRAGTLANVNTVKKKNIVPFGRSAR